MSTTDQLLVARAERAAAEHALDLAHSRDVAGILGFGTVVLRDRSGRVVQADGFANTVTDVGDLYYAQQAIKTTPPAAAGAPSIGLVQHMKLGTGGATANAKSGTGSFVTTYIGASSLAFDATWPQTANLGAGLGVNAVYRSTWVAGNVVNAAINEVAMSTDTVAGNPGTAANTIARAQLTSVNKTAQDSLQVTWNHKFLG